MRSVIIGLLLLGVTGCAASTASAPPPPVAAQSVATSAAPSPDPLAKNACQKVNEALTTLSDLFGEDPEKVAPLLYTFDVERAVNELTTSATIAEGEVKAAIERLTTAARALKVEIFKDASTVDIKDELIAMRETGHKLDVLCQREGVSLTLLNKLDNYPW